MKRKLLPLLAGIAAIAITAAPAFAQSTEPSHDFPMLSELDLTEEQKSQLEAIWESSRSEIESLLTPEQQEQFQTVRQQRQELREAREELNLSSEQKDQIRSIMQSAREEARNVLTDEQRQELRQEMRSRQGQRGQGRFRLRNR
jgi:Spy/CpxP family protein refolding chaperone